MHTCDFCGARAETKQVEFRQNTGMLVMRQSKTWAGNSCRDCASKYFWKATLHTMFLGWWGTISLILTPIFIISNIGNFIKTRSLKTGPVVTQKLLEEHRAYAESLLATKDRDTAVQVLAKESGVSYAEASAYVDSLSAQKVSA
jgi:hypothetical protein